METEAARLRGIAPTGREFTCRMVALFLFEGDRIVCQRVYFDSSTILRALRGDDSRSFNFSPHGAG